MFYNNSKNLSALALILAMSFSLADMSFAQGVVTMVDEEVDELGLPDSAIKEDVSVEEQEIPVVGEAAEDETAKEVTIDIVEEQAPSEVEENLKPDEEISTEQKETVEETKENSDKEQEAISSGDYDSDIAKELNDIAELEDTLSSLNNEENTQKQTSAQTPKSEDSFLASSNNNSENKKRMTALGDSVLSQIDNELFTQMSDIEKQTTLLSLELRREKLKSEIAAIKAQRELALEQAEDEKLAREQKRKDQQTEKEIEKIKELQILEDKRAQFETLRQEKVINDYKNKMLESEQKWIEESHRLYDKIKSLEDERKDLISQFERKFNLLKDESAKLIDNAKTAKTDHETVVSSLIAQNAQLKKRLEAEAALNANPFGANAEAQEPAAEVPPALDYVIMEIRGKGDDLIAKLINENGESFLVKKGSILKTGHVINKITHNYIKLENDGIEDYLYFAAAGAVPQEPVSTNITSKATDSQKETEDKKDKRPTLMMDDSIPSLGNGMFVK